MPTPNERLFSAIVKKNIADVRQALEDEADVNALTSFGITPLIQACIIGHVDIIKELVKSGADINIYSEPDEDKSSPIMVAANMRHPEAAIYLASAGAIFEDDISSSTLLNIKNVLNIGTQRDGGRAKSSFQYYSNIISKIKNAISDDVLLSSMLEEIANAFAATEKICNFLGGISLNPDKELLLAARARTGEPTILSSGWTEHATGYSIVDDYLVLTNRGMGCDAEPGTKIYKITDPSLITKEYVSTIVNAHITDASMATIKSMILDIVGGTDAIPIVYIPQKHQKRGNCTSANKKSNLRGLMLVQAARKHGGLSKIYKDESLLATIQNENKSRYKIVSNAIRNIAAEDLCSMLDNTHLDLEEYAKVVALAEQYIKQHLNFKKPEEIYIAMHLLAKLPNENKEQFNKHINNMLIWSITSKQV
ncbi:MAG: ankyrin repeat domain-containing protein [Francisellaceae bacterium]|jgi:hypothetical protein|nr:ankyrin repeat domain-containing protein [Francisellaceae bacterium]MBT6538876.1 ankyrin repeat domain-containing protein [Francisellaceae bacterium]